MENKSVNLKVTQKQIAREIDSSVSILKQYRTDLKLIRPPRNSENRNALNRAEKTKKRTCETIKRQFFRAHD